MFEQKLASIPAGKQIEISVNVDRVLSLADLNVIAARLKSNGVRVSNVESSDSGLFKIRLENPGVPSSGQYGALPLVVLIIGALGAVGVASVVGWKVSTVVDQIAKNLVPIALIGGGIFLLYSMVRK
jgi:hypothetical protein